MNATIAVLPGDGIGPEIASAALAVLRAVEDRFSHRFTVNEMPIGWAAIDKYDHPLPEEIHQHCRAADAIWLGAMGLPGRDETLPQDKRPERAALLPLREGNFANLRPIWLPPCMARPGHPTVDILIVRELNGGIYTGQPRGREEVDGETRAFDTMDYTVSEIRRIAEVAFDAAGERRKQVCSVDKANILSTSALWRETVIDFATDYPDIELRHQLVDSAAPAMVQRPQDFDVMLTGNMFGDILSDLGGALVGSLGMLPSASIGGKVGLFEPAHGSAPDIAGKDVVNPIASILTMGMLLEFALGLHAEADAIRAAVLHVLESGYRTADIMDEVHQQVGCARFADMTAEYIAEHGKSA